MVKNTEMKKAAIIMIFMFLYSSQYIRESYRAAQPVDLSACYGNCAHESDDLSVQNPQTKKTLTGKDACKTVDQETASAGTEYKYLNRFIIVE
jgi:hypothetical protein